MSDIQSLTEMLKKLVPLPTSTDPMADVREQWPVLHIPLFANVFPLAYCYFQALKEQVDEFNRTPPTATTAPSAASKLDFNAIRRRFLTLQEWGKGQPIFDKDRGEDVRNHIFIADERQKARWGLTTGFWVTKIFDYDHLFLLITKKNSEIHSPGSRSRATLDWKGLINRLALAERATIVTDILPEAEAVKDVLLQGVAGKPTIKLNSLDIIDCRKRDFHDVLDRYGPSAARGQQGCVDEECRILLFGTPSANALKARNKHFVVNIGNSVPKVKSYVCWRSTDYRAPLLYLRVLSDFFRALKDLKTSKQASINVSRAFHRIAESRGSLVGIDGDDEDKFSRIFWECLTHMTFDSSPSLIWERVGPQ